MINVFEFQSAGRCQSCHQGNRPVRAADAGPGDVFYGSLAVSTPVPLAVIRVQNNRVEAAPVELTLCAVCLSQLASLIFPFRV